MNREFGLRGRTLLVALPLLVGICFVSVYADMVSKTVQFGVLQLAPPAVVGLFALALLNRGLARLFKRELLRPGDILLIYVMLLVGVMVSTRGVVEKVIPPLAFLPYYATDANGLDRHITRHLPAWAMPFTPTAAMQFPDTIKRYHEGLRPGETIPWSVWAGPLLIWGVLIGCVVVVFACLGTLLRRRWMDEEKLTFPLTRLPLAILRDEVEHQPFLRNKTMWAGFAIAALVFGLNGLQANIPNYPGITVDFNLSPLLTQRPWSEMDGIRLYLSLAAIGFAYFLPGDLLFSIWFFFLLTRAQDLVAVTLGNQPTSIGTHNARIWTGYQAAGAYLVLIVAQVRIGWPFFRQAWETAFGQGSAKPLDDSGELMSYRAAFLGLFAGFGGIVLWLTAAGMSPVLAAAQMGLYLFLIAVIMTRSVSEAGLLMTETSFLPSHLIRLVAPLPSLGPGSLSLMAMTDIVFTRDLRGVLLSPLMDSQKLAGETRVRQRALLLPLGLAVVVSYAVASYFYLQFHYTLGGINLYVYPRGNATNMFNNAVSFITASARPPDSTAYGGLAVGVVVAAGLVWLRAAFAWFPLNPLAYAIAPTWSMYVFWFPFFLAWVIKSVIARLGSIGLYRRIAPFMLGMILGEFTSAVFWALMSTPVIGWNAPSFPWP
jgi:hypothetical protein